MKAAVDAKEFTKTLSGILRVIPQRTPLPVLQCVKIETVSEGLILQGSDEVQFIRLFVEAEIDTDGVSVVPARLLNNIVQLMDGKVALEQDGSFLGITSYGSEFNLNTLPEDEFMEINFRGDNAGEVDGDRFADALRKVVFSAAQGNDRPVLLGVNIKTHEGGVTLTTGDGFRVTVIEIPMDSSLPKGSYVVPAHVFWNFIHNFRGDQIRIETQENRISFFGFGYVCASQTINAEYPDLGSFINTNHTTRAKVNRKEFLKVLRGASLISDRVLTLSFTEDRIHVSSTGVETGTSDIDFDAEIEGPQAFIGLSPELITEAVATMTSDTIDIGMTDENNMLILTEENFLHGLMPMHIRKENDE